MKNIIDFFFNIGSFGGILLTYSLFSLIDVGVQSSLYNIVYGTGILAGIMCMIQHLINCNNNDR